MVLSNSNILILGATGGIGKQCLLQLLDRADVASISVLVRDVNRLPEEARNNPKVKVHTMTHISKVTTDQMCEYIKGVDSVLLSLGQNMTFYGIFVDDVVVTKANQLVIGAIERLKQRTKFIEINTIGVANPNGIDDIRRGFGTKFVIGLCSLLLPPFRGSKYASSLFHSLGENHPYVQWCMVRPDSLINEEKTEYEALETLDWAISKPFSTNRATAASFMVDLALNEKTWSNWVFKFPIVLNAGQL